jgi:hypothetical protein
LCPRRCSKGLRRGWGRSCFQRFSRVDAWGGDADLAGVRNVEVRPLLQLLLRLPRSRIFGAASRQGDATVVDAAGGLAFPPPPPSRTKRTRLVHPSVLTGHVSSFRWAGGHQHASLLQQLSLLLSGRGLRRAARRALARRLPLRLAPRLDRRVGLLLEPDLPRTRRVRLVRGEGRDVSA